MGNWKNKFSKEAVAPLDFVLYEKHYVDCGKSVDMTFRLFLDRISNRFSEIREVISQNSEESEVDIIINKLEIFESYISEMREAGENSDKESVNTFVVNSFKLLQSIPDWSLLTNKVEALSEKIGFEDLSGKIPEKSVRSRTFRWLEAIMSQNLTYECCDEKKLVSPKQIFRDSVAIISVQGEIPDEMAHLAKEKSDVALAK